MVVGASLLQKDSFLLLLKDEFHSRLRFNRRGLLGMANAGPHDNGSQFFFTFGAAPELDRKHTIFGKVKACPTVSRYSDASIFLSVSL